MFSTKKKYLHHKIHDYTQSEMMKLTLNDSTKDRAYMGDQLIPHIKFLESRGISEIPNVIQMFHAKGFRAADKRHMITSFGNFMKEEKKIEVPLLKSRELYKSNDCDKNIVICSLLAGYSTDFMFFLEDYIKQFPKIIQPKIFLDELNEKIKLLSPISTSSFSNNADILETYQSNAFEPSDSYDYDPYFEGLLSGTDF